MQLKIKAMLRKRALGFLYLFFGVSTWIGAYIAIKVFKFHQYKEWMYPGIQNWNDIMTDQAFAYLMGTELYPYWIAFIGFVLFDFVLRKKVFKY